MSRELVQTLIPHLAEVRLRIGEDLRVDPAKSRLDELYLEQLPYCLGAAHQSIERLLIASANLLSEGELQPGSVHVPAPDSRDILGFAVDSFLEASTRTQNALTWYISKGLRVSAPSSFSKLVKRIEGGKITVSSFLREQIVEYWHRSGARLRAYRNLSQHHGVVSSDVRLFLGEDQTPCIYLVLPTNPDETNLSNLSKLSYRTPLVHAIPYTIDTFGHLAALVFRVTRILLKLAPPSDLAPGERLFTKVGMRFAEMEGAPLIDVASLHRMAAEFARNEESSFLAESSGS